MYIRGNIFPCPRFYPCTMSSPSESQLSRLLSEKLAKVQNPGIQPAVWNFLKLVFIIAFSLSILSFSGGVEKTILPINPSFVPVVMVASWVLFIFFFSATMFWYMVKPLLF